MKVSTVMGTGAAINVSLGYIPAYVRVFNPNDAGALYPIVDYTADNNVAATPHGGLKTLAASVTKLTTATGVTPFAGVQGGAAPGFTIGTDTDLNFAGELIAYIAERGGAGEK